MQVCVWSMDTLSLEHVLPQPSGGVGALVAAGDCVLGGVGSEAVVWGSGDIGKRRGGGDAPQAEKASCNCPGPRWLPLTVQWAWDSLICSHSR